MVIIKDIDKKDSEFIDIVKSSYSIADICRKLNIKPYGGNYRVIKNKIKKLNIDTSHMTGQAWNQGDRKMNYIKPIADILVNNSHYKSYRLAKRLVKEGLKEHKCECCGLKEWMGKVIKLELHHINGDPCDNRFENLQLLCPNCHSYTDNYRGKNKRKNK